MWSITRELMTLSRVISCLPIAHFPVLSFAVFSWYTYSSLLIKVVFLGMMTSLTIEMRYLSVCMHSESNRFFKKYWNLMLSSSGLSYNLENVLAVGLKIKMSSSCSSSTSKSFRVTLGSYTIILFLTSQDSWNHSFYWGFVKINSLAAISTSLFFSLISISIFLAGNISIYLRSRPELPLHWEKISFRKASFS